jgi:DNA-binding NtrC family response regulator
MDMRLASAGKSLVFESQVMVDIVNQVDRLAPTPVPILFVGETGTGKELLAARVHDMSGRAGEFTDINCGALPRDMVESLLFGHARGAFTGAVTESRGLIRSAEGGTLFLDELTSLPLDGQAKLLRVLETGEHRPLGARLKVRSDFRVVAAVQEDLNERLEMGAFRRDLYYRVGGAVIEVPPLRSRPSDILPLARHFAAVRGRGLEPAAEALLCERPWLGNVRELRAVVERASVTSDSGDLRADQIRSLLGAPQLRVRGPAARGIDDPEAAALIRICADCGWSAERAAQALKISRATMYRRLARYGINLRVRLNPSADGDVSQFSQFSRVS